MSIGRDRWPSTRRNERVLQKADVRLVSPVSICSLGGDGSEAEEADMAHLTGQCQRCRLPPIADMLVQRGNSLITHYRLQTPLRCDQVDHCSDHDRP